MADLNHLIRQDEYEFLLFNWLKIKSDERETFSAMLNVCNRLAVEEFLPSHKKSDTDEPEFVDGEVIVIPEIKFALKKYAEIGMFGAGFKQELGGFGLSYLLCTALFSQFAAANISASAFPMLTNANARLIAHFGTTAQIQTFALPQIEGRWFGTMCLSEPQAGSSLGDIRTKAVADGSDEYGQRFRLYGNKMWISGGDQNISDNIIHLVLAKEADDFGKAQSGSKGISLFIVPKILPDGVRNDVQVAGINHKMGYRGIPNCLLNFGEKNGAIGWRVGQAGQGLAQMFQMMNEARIGVGVGAAALAYRGYRHALQYAQERKQGRKIGQKGGEPIAIIEHGDVKLMLMRQKSYAEGSLALTLYCADLHDQSNDDDAKELLGLLTPIAKSWPSEFGLIANNLAIQVHGGYGYTREFDLEQLWRENRLNPIHEGTTGIHAIDLLGRKILRSDGKGLSVLKKRVRETCQRANNIDELAALSAPLIDIFRQIDETIEALRDCQSPYDQATNFLNGFGHAVLAWIWLDLAITAHENKDTDFMAGKIRACQYFFETELPHALVWLSHVNAQYQTAIHTPISEF